MTFVLRVLDGRLARTETPLAPGEPVTIGHGFDNMVVLRGGGGEPVAVTLTPGEDGCGSLEVREGSVLLLSQTVAARPRAPLPAFVPVTVGGFALAWGGAVSARWTEAQALAAPLPVPVGEVVVAESPEPPRNTLPALARRIGGIGREMFFAGGTVLTLLLIVPPVTTALNERAPPVDIVRLALADRFPTLQAHATPTGNVLVTGTVATEGEAARVRAALKEADVSATVAVQTGAALADTAARVFRDNGIAARATWVEDGVVRVDAAPMPAELRDRLVNLALGDVPGLRRLELGAAAASAPVLGYAADAAAKRVASVVDGDPGFLVTADGARYFPGAVLPNGQRLVAVQAGAAVFERAGRTQRINFNPEGGLP